MGAYRARSRELVDSQPTLLIRIDSHFEKADLRFGESVGHQFATIRPWKKTIKKKILQFFPALNIIEQVLPLDKNAQKVFFWLNLQNNS